MKQNIIIFEGADKSGKTTIAKELSKRTGLPIFKVQRNKYNWDKDANLQYGTEQITQFLEQTGASVILDRFHPSDYMYSKLFGRTVNMKKVREIDARLAEIGTVIVYCYKDPEFYVEDEEDKDFVNSSMYDRMTSLYQQFATLSSSCKHIFLNTSDQDIEKQIKTIKKLLK
jgi:thymidylate kinase